MTASIGSDRNSMHAVLSTYRPPCSPCCTRSSTFVLKYSGCYHMKTFRSACSTSGIYDIQWVAKSKDFIYFYFLLPRVSTRRDASSPLATLFLEMPPRPPKQPKTSRKEYSSIRERRLRQDLIWVFPAEMVSEPWMVGSSSGVLGCVHGIHSNQLLIGRNSSDCGG